MSYDTAELIEDLKKSGLSQKDYCAQKNVSISTLAYHLRKRKKNVSVNSNNQQKPSFLPVNLGPSNGQSPRTVIILRGNFSCEELLRIIDANVETC